MAVAIYEDCCDLMMLGGNDLYMLGQNIYAIQALIVAFSVLVVVILVSICIPAHRRFMGLSRVFFGLDLSRLP